MNVLKITTCVCLLGAGVLTSKADNTTGINLYESGMYNSSKIYFLKQLNAASSPEEKAEACYYLGKSYLNLNHPDSASYYFSLGNETSATYPFNKIGTSMLALEELSGKGGANKEELKAFETAFKDAIKVDKKNIRLPLAVAEAYAYAKNYAKAEEYIKLAKKTDAKNGLPFMLEGDILLEQDMEKNRGAAGTKYDNAIYFSPGLVGAYMKSARIYMLINGAAALEKLEQIAAIAPDFNGRFYLLGELHEIQGNSKRAAEYYGRFIEDGYYNEEHLLKYAGILYFDKQYDNVLAIIHQVLEKYPDNLVANRLHAYALAKTTKGQESVDVLTNFMENIPEEKIILQDYLCYAEELEENKQYPEAADYYKKVIQKDPDRKQLLQNIGELYTKSQQPDSAIRYYNLYLDFLEQPNASIYFQLGRNYYNIATADSSDTQSGKLQRADSVFSLLTELAPASYLSYFWRARINSMLDPETTLGLAKPFYEKVIEITTEQTDRYKRELIECYKYLGYYYYVQADNITAKHNNNASFARQEYNTAKEYFQKVFELDPNDSIAQKAIEDINVK
ncbi:MAG: hypothetical protein LBG31_05005 [Prevotellaceae bacterium]|jgi:tetratricopeptide (TPR) repeat protein|nr:hypothetical protein [Prevotellaceae bacterium]